MFTPLRALPQSGNYKKGDVLVVFGELFSRGYANGIVDEAEKLGMTIVRSTVGRRGEEGLRPLNAEERKDIPAPFINVPLEAGFDLEVNSSGQAPVDELKGYKMDQWSEIRLNWKNIEESRQKGIARFKAATEKYMKELEAHIPAGANVLFVHTMAGGVPRTKILMPVMNKVFKGRDERFISSEAFWTSDLGKLCDWNFNEVTAHTFDHLVTLSTPLREKIEKNGGHAAYVAYGYHGTEVLHKDEFQWQTYSPYIQGWAKIKLEQHCEKYFKQGLNTSVYNCPEILTNSSSIFQGVEVPLYPLMGALEKFSSTYTTAVLERCKQLLKPEHSVSEIMTFTNEFFRNPLIKSHMIYEKWPQHNSKDQMELLLNSSEKLIEMHKDPKDLITFVLSEEIFKATGSIMLHESWRPTAPVLWLGHDILTKQLTQYS